MGHACRCMSECVCVYVCAARAFLAVIELLFGSDLKK